MSRRTTASRHSADTVRAEVERLLAEASNGEEFFHDLLTFLAHLGDTDRTNPVVDGLVRQSELSEAARDAAGVYHDLGNLTHGLLGALETAIVLLDAIEPAGDQQVQQLDEVRGVLDQVLPHVRTAQAVVKDSLALVETNEHHPRTTRLRTALETAQRLTPIDEHTLYAADTVPDVVLDVPPGQFLRVLLNLLDNAHDAVKGIPHRRVRLSAWATDEMAFVQVEDNGPGLAVAREEVVFELNFTTKEHGSGVGLFVARTLVRRWGGLISFDSEPGRGAAFTFSVPLVPEGRSSPA